MAEDPKLLARIRETAPGFYTERDGGDWYIVTPEHDDRIGEDFAKRDDARKCLAWLAGDPMPRGWKLSGHTELSAFLDCGQGYAATIWTRAIARAWPNKHLWADGNRTRTEG